MMNQSGKKTILRDRFGDNAVLGGLFFALLFFLMSYPLITDRTLGTLILDVVFRRS